MKPKKPKRVRKPASIFLIGIFSHPIKLNNSHIEYAGQHYTSKQAKKLHAWLGRAIIYLEQGVGK
jgi:hypothetical protein